MLIEVKVAKLNTVESFDVESLPPASLEYAIRYGLTQAINDAHASVSKMDEGWQSLVAEKVAKRVEQIRSGNVPGTRQPADPKAKQARELMKAAEAAGLDMAEVEAAIQAAAAKKARKH